MHDIICNKYMNTEYTAKYECDYIFVIYCTAVLMIYRQQSISITTTCIHTLHTLTLDYVDLIWIVGSLVIDIKDTISFA